MTQFHVWWALENGSADRQSMTVVRPLDRLIRFVEPTAVSNRRTDRQTTDLWLILLANVYVYCRHRQLHAIWQKSSISETQTNELSTSIRLEISPIMHLVLCRLLERNAPEPTSGDRKDADRSLLGYIGLSYTWQRSFTRSMFNEAIMRWLSREQNAAKSFATVVYVFRQVEATTPMQGRPMYAKCWQLVAG